MKKNYVCGIAALSAVLLLAGCGSNSELTPVEFCEENGGVSQEEVCLFDDGSYCEAEAFANGECGKGDIVFNVVEEEDVEEEMPVVEEEEVVEEEVIEEENLEEEVSVVEGEEVVAEESAE